MPFLAFLKFLSPRAWLAIGVVVALGLIVFLGSALADAKGDVRDLQADLVKCGKDKDALTAQIKSNAIEEGKRYEAVEAAARAQCGAAYDAGAQRLRDDRAVAAGRYVPGRGAGQPKR